LDEAVELGIYQINLCGGDGFCRDDFPKIIASCIERNIIVDVSTKCYIDEDLASELARAGLDYIQVSIDSYDERTADFMFGKNGHFRKVTQTIRNLISAGIFTRTNTIVTPYNFDHMVKTVEFLQSLGITEMKFTPAFRSYFNDNSDCMLPFEKKNAFKTVMAEIAEEKKKEGLAIFYDAMTDFTEMNLAEKKEYWFVKRARCSAGRCSLVITPDGKVVSCEETPQTEEFFIGDLKKQSIKEVWNSPCMMEVTYPPRQRFSATACYECSDFDRCVKSIGHCFRDCLKVYHDMYETNPFCPKAKASHNRIY
jgi:radical SAM protein with 4Fe4S-binding SPASM domain